MDTVKRVRRTISGVDRYGAPVYSTTEADLPDGRFVPRHVVPAVEVGRQATVVEPTIYWHNAWPDVKASDRLIVRGRTYEVLSDTSEWRGDKLGGLVVVLRASTEGVP